MDVKLFKLTNGQDLVAEVIAPTSLGWKIRRPVVIQMVAGQDGGSRPIFVEWTLIDETEELELRDNGIAAGPLTPFGPVAQSYIQQMTGVVVPTAPPSRILHG